MNKNSYTAEEVAGMFDGDAQTLRDQVRSDIANGTNKDDWNARMSGKRIIFSKADIDEFFRETLKKKPVGPVIKFTPKGAEWLIKNGFAVEVQDGEE